MNAGFAYSVIIVRMGRSEKRVGQKNARRKEREKKRETSAGGVRLGVVLPWMVGSETSDMRPPSRHRRRNVEP